MRQQLELGSVVLLGMRVFQILNNMGEPPTTFMSIPETIYELDPECVRAAATKIADMVISDSCSKLGIPKPVLVKGSEMN